MAANSLVADKREDAEQVLAMVTATKQLPVKTLLTTGGACTVPNDENTGRQLVDPRAVRRHDDPMDLVELARAVQVADKFVTATTGGKLQVIVDQIRSLQKQAHDILETAERDSQLHHAACNFTKVPGQTYHLYRRPDGSTHFSMLSPRDWGAGRCPHTHLGSYRLEHDHSWTSSEQLESRSRDIEAINKVIHTYPALDYTNRT